MILEILKYLGILMVAGSGAFLAAALHVAKRSDEELERAARIGARSASHAPRQTVHSR